MDDAPAVDIDPHDGSETGCPGMWRFRGAVLDLDEGSTAEYVCDLCGGLLLVPPGGLHPRTA